MSVFEEFGAFKPTRHAGKWFCSSVLKGLPAFLGLIEALLKNSLLRWVPYLQGNTENNSLPVDLIIEEYIEETALEPGHKIYHSLINMIKEKGLAIPLKK